MARRRITASTSTSAPENSARKNRPRKNNDGWIVHGKKPGNPWVIPVAIILMGVLVVMTYQRFMAFDSVSYELHTCQTPLAADSTWGQIESARCEPLDADGTELVIYEGSSRHAPDIVAGNTFSFDSFPVNSVEHSIQVQLPFPARSVVIAEPDNTRVRRALSSVQAGIQWSGYIGQRGPTRYWVLISPDP